MEFNPLNLLAQVPLVAIFIWFVLKRDKQYQDSTKERDKQWQDYLRERNGREEKALTAMTDQLKHMGDKLQRHTESILRK